MLVLQVISSSGARYLLNSIMTSYALALMEKKKVPGAEPYPGLNFLIQLQPVLTLSNGPIPKIAQYLLEVIVPGLMILPSRPLPVVKLL